ncbi:FAD-dependent oxidoreductase [Novosphingobium sp. FSY-8]|uniref:FAD-dependent oxidoreductase n=1 Tax=Novosphingobium ovatum TaxID=1908523 RepID=A0ABW9X9C6_9SPHN|nr:FAD-dependent oxidoreductase [Novosphingobium ovatum]NBC35115.1 FAD-dependent oxidoreductase [Novosphingobium ovatum]
MKHTILVAGSGFAGLWAALSACRIIALSGRQDDIQVLVVSPAPMLTIRPRLYEAPVDAMTPDIAPLLAAVGAKHVAGAVESLDIAARQATVRLISGETATIPYDRLVLATGSRLHRPAVPGLDAFAFDNDTYAQALALEQHIQSLASLPPSLARDTVIVAGGGLTGVETATEMPMRLRAALDPAARIRVVMVDTGRLPGEALGAAAAAHVQAALTHAGVELRLGTRVTAISTEGVTLSSGEHIAARTVIWSAGLRAHPLAAQIPGQHDDLGRVHADAWLRAPDAAGVFVTGDMAHIATDDVGHVAPMSCQHALSLGRVAGHNAAADLMGLPMHAYSQPKYVTCIDLGAWGALYTEGWDRQVRHTHAEAKAIKQEINRVWIYPPAPDRDVVFAIANPDHVIVP